MHGEGLHNLNSSTSITRKIKAKNEMGWTCGTHRREHKRIQGFGGKPFVRSRRGW